MKANIRWLQGVSFLAESGTGHKVVLDGPQESGGLNAGMRPMELMLLSVGGCASYDVITILRKARQQVTNCEADVEGERVDEIPAVFSSIHIHFKVSGKELKEKQVARAISLSAEKYCSATAMLVKGGVKFTHDFEIIED